MDVKNTSKSLPMWIGLKGKYPLWNFLVCYEIDANRSHPQDVLWYLFPQLELLLPVGGLERNAHLDSGGVTVFLLFCTFYSVPF